MVFGLFGIFKNLLKVLANNEDSLLNTYPMRFRKRWVSFRTLYNISFKGKTEWYIKLLSKSLRLIHKVKKNIYRILSFWLLGESVTHWHKKEAMGIMYSMKKNRLSGKLQILYVIALIRLIRELIGTRPSQSAANKWWIKF